MVKPIDNKVYHSILGSFLSFQVPVSLFIAREEGCTRPLWYTQTLILLSRLSIILCKVSV
jgi:hypothetical protein